MPTSSNNSDYSPKNREQSSDDRDTSSREQESSQSDKIKLLKKKYDKLSTRFQTEYWKKRLPSMSQSIRRKGKRIRVLKALGEHENDIRNGKVRRKFRHNLEDSFKEGDPASLNALVWDLVSPNAENGIAYTYAIQYMFNPNKGMPLWKGIDALVQSFYSKKPYLALYFYQFYIIYNAQIVDLFRRQIFDPPYNMTDVFDLYKLVRAISLNIPDGNLILSDIFYSREMSEATYEFFSRDFTGNVCFETWMGIEDKAHIGSKLFQILNFLIEVDRPKDLRVFLNVFSSKILEDRFNQYGGFSYIFEKACSHKSFAVIEYMLSDHGKKLEAFYRVDPMQLLGANFLKAQVGDAFLANLSLFPDEKSYEVIQSDGTIGSVDGVVFNFNHEMAPIAKYAFSKMLGNVKGFISRDNLALARNRFSSSELNIEPTGRDLRILSPSQLALTVVEFRAMAKDCKHDPVDYERAKKHLDSSVSVPLRVNLLSRDYAFFTERAVAYYHRYRDEELGFIPGVMIEMVVGAIRSNNLEYASNLLPLINKGKLGDVATKLLGEMLATREVLPVFLEVLKKHIGSEKYNQAVAAIKCHPQCSNILREQQWMLAILENPTGKVAQQAENRIEKLRSKLYSEFYRHFNFRFVQIFVLISNNVLVLDLIKHVMSDTTKYMQNMLSDQNVLQVLRSMQKLAIPRNCSQIVIPLSDIEKEKAALEVPIDLTRIIKTEGGDMDVGLSQNAIRKAWVDVCIFFKTYWDSAMDKGELKERRISNPVRSKDVQAKPAKEQEGDLVSDESTRDAVPKQECSM